MWTAALILALASTGPPAPTPAPTPTARPTAKPALSRDAKASSRPNDLSSYAGKVKVDRGRVDSLFSQTASAPTEPAPPGTRATPGTSSQREPASSSGEEARWRDRAASLRQEVQRARERMAETERTLPPEATSSEGTDQRKTLLHWYQVQVDRSEAALDALADECRRSPGCEPGWVR